MHVEKLQSACCIWGNRVYSVIWEAAIGDHYAVAVSWNIPCILSVFNLCSLRRLQKNLNYKNSHIYGILRYIIRQLFEVFLCNLTDYSGCLVTAVTVLLVSGVSVNALKNAYAQKRPQGPLVYLLRPVKSCCVQLTSLAHVENHRAPNGGWEFGIFTF